MSLIRASSKFNKKIRLFKRIRLTYIRGYLYLFLLPTKIISIKTIYRAYNFFF